MIKAYKLKISDCNFDIENVIKEQQNYYNNFSMWINSHLTHKVSDVLLPYFEEKSKNTKYYQNVVDKQDLHLYTFIKVVNHNFLKNAFFFSVVKNLNVDQYNGNILNISDTDYRLQGYINAVLENYKSSLKLLKPKVKSHAITNESDDDKKCQQCVYELNRHNDFFNEKGWEDYIKYLNNKADVSQNILDRINILFEYYKNNKDYVNEQYNLSCISRLVSYNGCVKDQNKLSMTVNSGNKPVFSLEPISDDFGYKMTLIYGRDATKRHSITLKGHRNLIEFKNGERIEKTNLTEEPCHTLTLTKEASGCYAIATCNVEFSKESQPIENVVGVDINTKHTLLSTSIIDDGRFSGYFNIYKVLLKDREFLSLIENNKQLVQIYTELSKSVTFCPIESEFLYTRKYNTTTKNAQIEKCISKVLKQYQDGFYKIGDIDNRNYVAHVKMLRSKISSYFTVYMKYLSEQSKFDKDILNENLVFSSTEQGVGFWKKLHSIESDIIGCRDNIINYAFRLFRKNGYDTISLESLTSSSFEKSKSIPSIDSMLDYPKHGWRGMNINDVKATKDYEKFSDKYEFILDNENNVIDLAYTEKGIETYYKPLFYNLIIKKVNFASIKDKFIEISNNTNINIVIVPSFFTSIMDSTDHKIFVDENHKRLDKSKIRVIQEKYINGLNADYNAANNIAFLAKDKEWRTMLCNEKPKFDYSTPVYESKIKSPDKMYNTIVKMGAYKVFVAE